MDRHARTVGVDVGGTKVAVARLDGTTLGPFREEPTDGSSTDALLDQIVRLVADLGTVDAVGVGAPSVVRNDDGTVTRSANLHAFRDVPLRTALEDRLGVPVRVDNDANLAAVSEAWDDDLALTYRSLACLTVGTGLGSGFAVDGRPLHGAHTSAFELGHLTVQVDPDGGAPAGSADGSRAPYVSSLEHWASGRALDRLAVAHGYADGRAVTAAAERDDPTASDLVRMLGERVGVGIAAVVNLLEPEVVVLAGGVSRVGERLVGPARDAARRLVLPGVGDRTTITVARHGPAAGVRGAAILARLDPVR
ncbi:MAG: ROK family protein [Solirubrobacteraceae bacterium]|nr:ROK family protein [Solirubrobacteraceae bacterium]